MNPKIFREYDIRGVVDKDLTKETVCELGRGSGSYFAQHGIKRITVGRDCRPSSDPFFDALLEGLLASGMEVVDMGVCPTPLLYFSIVHLKKEGGVMITGSHNPPEFNGFKICVGKDAIYGREIQRVREIVEKRDYVKGKGSLSQHDIIRDYHHYILSNIQVDRGIKVVVDAGNGTGGVVGVPIMRELGCQVETLYCEMDGRFPNHHPDPTVEQYLIDLIATVKATRADLGIGYDGDADRIGVIDEQGRIIWGDKLMIIFARDIIKERRGGTFIGEVKCSQTLYDEIERLGGRAIMWKTGHSLIKDKMKKANALLAGEMSGHMFFADRYFGFDDAIYASCRLLEIVGKSGKKVSELLEGVPQTYVTPEIRINCPDDIKFQIVERATEHFRQGYQVIDVDGMRVTFPDGWGLLRASNTQPALVLRFEATTEERMDELRGMVEAKVHELMEGVR
ncbi:MAG: phosphomannomutase [Deltaproteobacteria bacterium RBG_13_52_11]|nr:MAG: phosphomannomutase [Deltaproteobacteria bacterium RBG_13_52_11]